MQNSILIHSFSSKFHNLFKYITKCYYLLPITTSTKCLLSSIYTDYPIGDYCSLNDGKRSRTAQQIAAKSLTKGELCGPNVRWRDGPPVSGSTFIRQCTATGNWSIFASGEYLSKPVEYKIDVNKSNLTASREGWKSDCPFCPGNEKFCPDAHYELKSTIDGENAWLVRVLPNKYSFLQDAPHVVCGFWGQHLQVTGTGIQEIIVLNKRHNTSPALMSVEELYLAVETLLLRGKLTSESSRILYVALFQNHGIKSGGSLEHPHFQVVGLPIVPTTVLNRLEHAYKFYQQNDECVFCRTLEDELNDLEGDGTRVIYETKEFVAFVPFAVTRAYQIWILPRQHSSSFIDIPPQNLLELTETLHACLRMIYRALGDPDYNIVIRTAPPVSRGTKERRFQVVTNASVDWQLSYHWYVEITPHTTEWAGLSCFEMNVLKQLPEEMAATLVKAHEMNEQKFEPIK